MAIRTGANYIAGIKRRPREVWLRGERVEDVTTHPAFEAPLRQIARLYDMQHDAKLATDLTYASPTSGNPVGTAFMVPRTLDDLQKRHRAFRIWAEATLGLMGRSPDFLNTTLMAFMEAKDVFARKGQQYADNVVNYYEYIRENDLFLTHALVTPQTDRSKASSEQADPFLHLGVVKETDDGLIVRGARMLATLGPIADEVLVYNLPGLKSPDDDPYAMVFALPLDTPGIKQISREPFDEGGRSSFDHPLAANFEEPDTLIIFDDVVVPWQRVFAHGDSEHANRIYPDTNVRQHTAHQTGVRGVVKMQFAVGLAMAIAEAVGANRFLHVQEKLGECLNYVELIEAAILRAEIEYEETDWGTVRAKFRPLQTTRTTLSRFYPRIIEVLQTLGAGGLLMMPSGADFDSEIGEIVDKYYTGAGGLASVDRVRLFKLAWDLCGDAFGQRQLQYERYYAGDPVRLLAGVYLTYEREKIDALVETAIELAGDPVARRDEAAE
jgi:anthranilate 3-monooxygenase (FAD)/4-hydroxyphenylacetate 3-monooxygenase